MPTSVQNMVLEFQEGDPSIACFRNHIEYYTGVFYRSCCWLGGLRVGVMISFRALRVTFPRFNVCAHVWSRLKLDA